MFIYDKFSEEIINTEEIANIWKEDFIDKEDKTFTYRICIIFKSQQSTNIFKYSSRTQRDVAFSEIKGLLNCVDIGS